jgi:hypothetical protein
MKKKSTDHSFFSYALSFHFLGTRFVHIRLPWLPQRVPNIASSNSLNIQPKAKDLLLQLCDLSSLKSCDLQIRWFPQSTTMSISYHYFSASRFSISRANCREHSSLPRWLSLLVLSITSSSFYTSSQPWVYFKTMRKILELFETYF